MVSLMYKKGIHNKCLALNNILFPFPNNLSESRIGIEFKPFCSMKDDSKLT